MRQTETKTETKTETETETETETNTHLIIIVCCKGHEGTGWNVSRGMTDFFVFLMVLEDVLLEANTKDAVEGITGQATVPSRLAKRANHQSFLAKKNASFGTLKPLAVWTL